MLYPSNHGVLHHMAEEVWSEVETRDVLTSGHFPKWKRCPGRIFVLFCCAYAHISLVHSVLGIMKYSS